MEAAKHGRQQIVEVMGDAARQLADRIHLLGMDQPAFQHALLADVGQRTGILRCSSRLIRHQHGLVEEMLVAAIGALPAIFDRKPAVSGHAFRALPSPAAGPPDGAASPRARYLLHLIEGETGHGGEIATDEIRLARGGLGGLHIEQDGQRLDDRRLALTRNLPARGRFAAGPAPPGNWRRAAAAPRGSFPRPEPAC